MSVYKSLDEQKQFACRVIADHARSTAFAIADGILPGNEGRNYVLRKIMRRAIYHGRDHLGLEGMFFHKVCGFVVEQMRGAYPELETQKDFIDKMVRLEEERFGNTVTVGLRKLDELFSSLDPSSPVDNIDHEQFARLYDTFGTPKDLIRVKLEEFFKTSVPEEDFNENLDRALIELQQTSEIGKTKQSDKINPIYAALENDSVRSEFKGYDSTSVENARVLALVKEDTMVDEFSAGDEGLIILDQTPFYAESGGQVGDGGTIVRTAGSSGRLKPEEPNARSKPSARADGDEEAANIRVFDTFAPVAGIILHKSKVENGTIRVGDIVIAAIDVEKRDAIRRNHTATHLVHAALKEVLGSHIKQAGSVVAANYLRFDFTHYQPISDVEVKEIEDLVNREILRNEKVNTNLMSIEEAMRSGAMALFGEKYGSTVRVLSVGGGEFSKELCGGTHVRATGDIGSFKIIADEAVASGVRRIRAITGRDAFDRFRDDEDLIARSLGVLKTQRDNLPNAIEKLQDELKKTRREVEDLKMKIATGAASPGSNDHEAKTVKGIRVIAKTVDGLDKGGMRHLSDTLMAKIKSGVVILARVEEDKVSFIVRVSDDLTGRVSAGNIVREIAPIVGGRGGGKADMAEGGGTDAGKLADALKASYTVIEQMLG